ncbi:hypothetical protein IMSAGC011_02002 [Lachnospiraceae bacterium]|nr:hypothetical protein IMSAGC011_02002 [Lachnospiraceae bacterium]
MQSMVKYEYRKLWNWVSIAAVIAMCILSTLHTFIYLNMKGQWRAIDTNGEIVSGLGSYRALREACKEIEGIIDDEYLKNLMERYAVSADKQYLDENRGFLGTGGMTKYMYPNYFINYAYFSYYMSNGNNKMGLDYDFLKSEESFYQKYREAIKEQLIYENQYAGLVKYTNTQIEVLDQKIADIDTPVEVAYCQGISNFMNWYDLEYPIFFVVLAFALSCTYAKDSPSGVSELTISTVKGRKKNFRARWIAGNLFAASVYFIFIGVLLIEHGVVASFSGFRASAQTYWFDCIFNFNIGTGMVLKIIGGLLGSLVFANASMLLSGIFKNSKVASVSAILVIAALSKMSNTYSQIKLFYPLQFSTDAIVKNFFIIGEALIPYSVVVLFLTVLYIAVFALLISRIYKKYHLN